MMDRRAHWEKIYTTKGLRDVSWTQATCTQSLDFIRKAKLPPEAPIIDIGGGASVLVDELLDLGYRDLTVLDVSAAALSIVRTRLGSRMDRVAWLEQDITKGPLPRSFALWHDRAVFHFLTDAVDREAYARTLSASLQPGGYLILSGFAKDGPLTCSGLDVRRYDCEDVQRELGGSLELLDRAKEDHATPFGTVQKFSYCFFKKG
jgi:SAM-dependent methyltransferase